jgi:rhamnulokinase
MLGTIASGKLAMEELHRFPNEPVRLPTGLYWNTFGLFQEILKGLAVAGRTRKLAIDGIGIDTWGVDFGLLGRDGALIDNPRHYRDARNNGMVERLLAAVPKNEVFAQTGTQFMQINSLCQLYAMKLGLSPGLEMATSLLMIPDLLNYWLTGVQKAEVTIASTSQFYDPTRKNWSENLLRQLGLPASILPPLIQPGTRLGPLLPAIAELTGLSGAQVFASAGHDTASAVAAVPAGEKHFCYISSGTWSLMGVELDAPLITPQALALNFTNEIGVGGKVRLLKNIAGLWILQECRRTWALQGSDYSYEDLMAMAAKSEPHPGYIDPDKFLEPGNMPEKIAAYCTSRSQPIPKGPGGMARAILEGLAQRYREVLISLEALIGHHIPVIHIVGGGSRNKLLNRLVAEATERRVIAGPAEATAIGNVLTQAIGAGAIADLRSSREMVRDSFAVEEG